MTREEAIGYLKRADTTVGKKIKTRTAEALEMAIKALEQEPCREADDYENEISDLYNRLDIAEYDKERLREEVTTLEEKLKGLSAEPSDDATLKDIFCMGCEYKEQEPILDKIRAEIMKLDDINPDYPMDRTIHVSRNEVLDIIDKYKAESEEIDADSN